jgi:hypothetical protein
MKPYRYVSVLAFFALCSQAFATSLLPTPNLNTNTQGQTQGQSQGQAQNQGQAQSATALSASGAIAGSAAISGASLNVGATTLNANAAPSNSAATNGNQSITFNTPAAPAVVETRASGTTEVRTVATVFAPDAVTTANCMVGASGGATGLGWGFAIGTGIEDKGCTRRENARLLKNLGKGDAAVKIMCNDPEVAAALGADCAVVAPLPAK